MNHNKLKQQGSILVEFAFIAPIMLVLSLGAIDLVRLHIATGYVVNAAQTTADVVSQENYVSIGTYKKYGDIVKTYLEPYPFKDVGYVYQSFSVDKSRFPSTIWVKKFGSLSSTPLAANSDVKKIAEAGKGVIMARVKATYEPILSFIIPEIEIEEYAYAVPRNNSQVCWFFGDGKLRC